MKFINKGPEPPEMTVWRNRARPARHPRWKNARRVKPKIREALLQEQGCLCCYCEARVGDGNGHVEHLKPRSLFPDLEADYSNLLCSCQGGNPDCDEETHCGHRKSDWYDEDLFVSPLDSDCEGRFSYTSDGDMRPADESDAGAETTIERLGLNTRELREYRREALEAVFKDLDEMDSAQVTTYVEALSDRDADGCFAEYVTALLHVLRLYGYR